MANPSQKKEDLIAEAEVLGIVVEDLPHDEGKDPTNATIADAINERQEAIAASQAELPIDVNLFLAFEPQQAVPLAGLLAARPELREGELKQNEWRQALDEYLNDPPPSDPPVPTEGD